MHRFQILFYILCLATLTGCEGCGAQNPDDLVRERELEQNKVPISPYAKLQSPADTSPIQQIVEQAPANPEKAVQSGQDVKMTSVSGANFIVTLTEQIALPKSVSFTHYSKQKTIIKGSTNFAFGESSITIFYGNAVGIESSVVLNFVSDFNREFTCNATIIRATVSDNKTRYALAIHFDREKSKIDKIFVGQTTYYKEGG